MVRLNLICTVIKKIEFRRDNIEEPVSKGTGSSFAKSLKIAFNN